MNWLGKKRVLTDGERLRIAIRTLDEFRKRFAEKDPWGFTGAIIVTYYALREGYHRSGEGQTFDEYEKNVISATSLEFPGLPAVETKIPTEMPYK